MSTAIVGEQNDLLTNIKLEFVGVPPSTMIDVSPAEVILGESLLTPGLQTSVRVHSYFHSVPIKNLDAFKSSIMKISMNRPLLKLFGITDTMEVSQVTYRVDNRKLINNVTEEFTLHACDQTLLNDASALVSKSWKCTRPSDVVSYVLRSCAGASQLDIESCDPARDYIAENIHPFQVVTQQSNVALAAGNDPSFVHYMTYENLGTHHFRSLNYLSKQSPVAEYFYNETGIAGDGGYRNPYGIMTHSFPCDFDLLSDILNGIDQNGKDINSMTSYNPLTGVFGLFGNQTLGCGIGGGVIKNTMTNTGSEQLQDACPDYAHLYLQKRQARMGLLEQDKIALRITAPWNPTIHAGKIIKLTLYNKNDPTQLNYGSGNYLVVAMTHNIKNNGFSTTTMDCVSNTVGRGIV